MKSDDHSHVIPIINPLSTIVTQQWSSGLPAFQPRHKSPGCVHCTNRLWRRTHGSTVARGLVIQSRAPKNIQHGKGWCGSCLFSSLKSSWTGICNLESPQDVAYFHEENAQANDDNPMFFSFGIARFGRPTQTDSEPDLAVNLLVYGMSTRSGFIKHGLLEAMVHQNQWCSHEIYEILHSLRGFSSHVWWHQRVPAWSTGNCGNIEAGAEEAVGNWATRRLLRCWQLSPWQIRCSSGFNVQVNPSGWMFLMFHSTSFYLILTWLQKTDSFE